MRIRNRGRGQASGSVNGRIARRDAMLKDLPPLVGAGGRIR
jgi:hypothetical protein